jgi:hypothetical protein
MHALCCYKQTLLEIARPTSHPVGSSQCSGGIARVSGLSVRFVHLSRGGKLRIAGCRPQGAQIGVAKTWMQTEGLCRTQFPRGVHAVGQSRPELMSCFFCRDRLGTRGEMGHFGETIDHNQY